MSEGKSINDKIDNITFYCNQVNAPFISTIVKSKEENTYIEKRKILAFADKDNIKINHKVSCMSERKKVFAYTKWDEIYSRIKTNDYIKIIRLNKEDLNHDSKVFMKETENENYINVKTNYEIDNLVLIEINNNIVGYGIFDKIIDNPETGNVFKKRILFNNFVALKKEVSRDILGRKFKIHSRMQHGYSIINNENELISKLTNSIPSAKQDIKYNISFIENLELLGNHKENDNKNKKRKKTNWRTSHERQIESGEFGEKLIQEYLEKDGSYKKIIRVSEKDDSLGFDILLEDNCGNNKYIEIKTKKMNINYIDFYISENELEKLKNENHELWYLFNKGGYNYFIYKFPKGEINKYKKNVCYRVQVDYK